MKDEVSVALNGIQITDSRFTNVGNIVMNFDNKNTKDESSKKLVLSKFVPCVGKVKLKIMICSVPKEERGCIPPVYAATD